MKDSQLLQTTSSLSRGNRSPYNLESPPPAEHVSYKPEMVGGQYGWVKIISPEKRWSKKWNHCYVLTQCQGCGSIQWQNLENLKTGKSKGCQGCSQQRQVPKWLYKRLSAAKQRCENQNTKNYYNYGRRGIKFLFPSVQAACLYLMEKFGIPEREMQLDRIDNNGDYAPGNLRFVTPTENKRNRRSTVLSQFDQKYWPYTRTVVTRKLSEGMTRYEIIEDAGKAVGKKCRNWHTISARLDFMTYEMPESITVLPYRGSWSTTAATGEVLEQ